MRSVTKFPFIFSLRAVLIAVLFNLSVVSSSCGGEKTDPDNNTMGAEPSFQDRDKAIKRMHNDTLKDRDTAIDSVNSKP